MWVELLIIAIAYIGYLVVWSIICLTAYALALVLRKPVVMTSVAGLGVVAVWLLNLLIGIGLLVYMIQLLFDKQYLWFVFMLFIGMALIKGLLGFLQMPFILIPSYFSAKLDDEKSEEGYAALETKQQVLKTNEVNRKLALFFIASYGLNVVSVLFNATDYPSWRWGDYILWPFLWVISQIVVIGFFVGIYLKLRRGKFFYPSKKVYLITVLKVVTIILAILGAVFFLTGIWTI